MASPPTTSELRPESAVRPEHENNARNQAEDKQRLKDVKKFLKKFNYNGFDGDWIQDARGSLLVVATVILAMTFQPLLSPPGGLWQETVAEGPVCGKHVCVAGKSVLAHTKGTSFITYMSFNTMTFSASLGIIFILISGVPLRNRLAMAFLGMCICIALITLSLSYISALYEISPDHVLMGGYTNVIKPLYVLVGLICSVIIYHIIRITMWILSYLYGN